MWEDAADAWRAQPDYAAESASLVAQAIRHLEQVLAVPPNDLGAQLLLGRLYAQAGQYGKSVGTIKAFLAEEPGYPEALLVLGQAAEGAGMWEDAADAWGQLSEMGARGRSYSAATRRPSSSSATITSGSSDTRTRQTRSTARSSAIVPRSTRLRSRRSGIARANWRGSDRTDRRSRRSGPGRLGLRPSDVHAAGRSWHAGRRCGWLVGSLPQRAAAGPDPMPPRFACPAASATSGSGRPLPSTPPSPPISPSTWARPWPAARSSCWPDRSVARRCGCGGSSGS